MNNESFNTILIQSQGSSIEMKATEYSIVLLDAVKFMIEFLLGISFVLFVTLLCFATKV